MNKKLKEKIAESLSAVLPITVIVVALCITVTPMPLAPLMLLYLGCISAVAYSLWGILLKYNPVSRVTVFSFMTPVFGVLLSAALLRETNTPHGAVCAAALVLVCIGICLVNRAGAPKDAPADTITKEN